MLKRARLNGPGGSGGGEAVRREPLLLTLQDAALTLGACETSIVNRALVVARTWTPPGALPPLCFRWGIAHTHPEKAWGRGRLSGQAKVEFEVGEPPKAVRLVGFCC